MLLFEKIWPQISHLEKKSRLFPRVAVAPTIMRFGQNMHMDIIKLFYLAEFRIFIFFQNIAPEYLKDTPKTRKTRKATKNFKKLKILKFR